MLTARQRYFRGLRAREFPQLGARGLAYLDYTGAALPARTQLRAQRRLLERFLLGNPHADHAPSRASTGLIAAARAATLRFLDADADEYEVCFTANASHAAKLVGEAFRFRRGGEFLLSADNHNSINGLREYARRAGARVRVLPLDADLRLDRPGEHLATRARGDRLLAFPAQSNFSGVRHPLSLVAAARRRGYTVLLDAAAYLPTHHLSLRRVRPDFVTLSFYKLFGFPTGVGALVARRESLRRLDRPWFAGGTVDWVSVRHREHRLRGTIDAFEDGTADYYGIAALEAGFAFLRRVGLRRLGAHVADLTQRLLSGLATARVRVYGPRDTRDRGGTVTFNALDRRGRVIPYDVVEAAARHARIAVRAGCFCNPGCAEAAFGFPAAASRRCLHEIVDFTPQRFARCLGDEIAVGGVRASLGAATSAADVDRLVEAVRRLAPP
jgi:selenocysteine lyase/cysteine desulfurase